MCKIGIQYRQRYLYFKDGSAGFFGRHGKNRSLSAPSTTDAANSALHRNPVAGRPAAP
jgi:hypothetical protein